MNTRAEHPFRLAAERGDIDALVGTLAPDVVLHSPVTFRPYVGRDTVGGVLRLVVEAFDRWQCIEQIDGPDGVTCLIFKTRVGDRDLEGVDLLRAGPDGLIVDLTVMIRPLSGLGALAEAMAAKVQAAGLSS